MSRRPREEQEERGNSDKDSNAILHFAPEARGPAGVVWLALFWHFDHEWRRRFVRLVTGLCRGACWGVLALEYPKH